MKVVEAVVTTFLAEAGFARVNKRPVRASTKGNVQCFHLHNWRDAAEQTAASSLVPSTKE